MAMVCIVVAAPAFAQQAPDTKPAAPPPATPPLPHRSSHASRRCATPTAPPAGGAGETPKTEAPKAEVPESEGTTLPPVQIIQEKPKPAPKKEAAPAPERSRLLRRRLPRLRLRKRSLLRQQPAQLRPLLRPLRPFPRERRGRVCQDVALRRRAAD